MKEIRVPLFGTLRFKRHRLGQFGRSALADFMDAVYSDEQDWALDSLDRNKVIRDATVKIRELERQNAMLRDYARSVRDGECVRCAAYAGRWIDGFKAKFKKHVREYQ